jgi:hypothetical protein
MQMVVGLLLHSVLRPSSDPCSGSFAELTAACHAGDTGGSALERTGRRLLAQEKSAEVAADVRMSTDGFSHIDAYGIDPVRPH